MVVARLTYTQARCVCVISMLFRALHVNVEALRICSWRVEMEAPTPWRGVRGRGARDLGGLGLGPCPPAYARGVRGGAGPLLHRLRCG
jgi:hypothetical protein